MERTFKPRLPQIVNFVTSGELEFHKPNSSSLLVIMSSWGQWNAALDLQQSHSAWSLVRNTSFSAGLEELLLTAGVCAWWTLYLTHYKSVSVQWHRSAGPIQCVLVAR